MSFWKNMTGSLTSITAIIQNDTPKKPTRSYEEPDDADLKQIYTGCHLLLKEYLQEGEKSKHIQFWQNLRDSLTNLGASADVEGLKTILNINGIIPLIETIRVSTTENTSNIDNIVGIFDIFQKYGLSYLHDLGLKVQFNQIQGKESHYKLLLRSIAEKKRTEEEYLLQKEMDKVVQLRDDLKSLHEEIIESLGKVIDLLLNLKSASKVCIFNVESQVALKQLPFEKENTFSLQFSQKVIDLYLEPLRVQITNADLDLAEFEIRRNKFFSDEGEKSRLQKEEFRRIEGLEEDLRHENEVKGFQTFLQQLIDKENDMHEHHKSGGSTDRVLEDLANQNAAISAYLKQREQDLQAVKAKRLEILAQRDIEEKKKKERLVVVGKKVKERLDWLEFSLKQYKSIVQERETFIKCLSCISNAIDRFVTSLNEIIEREMRSVVEKQIERINDYLNFLDQRIQAKTKDIDYLREKITRKNQKHAGALERDDQNDARELKSTIEQYTLKLQQSEAVLSESQARTGELKEKLQILTKMLAPNL